MNKILTGFKTHLPAYIAGALIVLNALEQGGIISLSTKIIVVINAVLAAFGLGVLHVRQQVDSKTTVK
jgi:hypothetical protein